MKLTTDDQKPSSTLSAKSAISPAKKVIIKSTDMKYDIQKEAVFEKNNVEKDVAEHIKKQLIRYMTKS
ncbi:hypothetical protein REPUB_Repub13aG0089800 [Reevesia pubescens]